MKEVANLVIGAGYGGLTLACLLARDGQQVTVIEGHSKLAGCAGSFKRKGFKFDAGATTLSGLSANRPVGKLLHDLGLNSAFKTHHQDPGIVFHQGETLIRRWSNLKRWIAELNQHFPGHDHHSYWTQVHEVENWVFESLRQMGTFPPRPNSKSLGFLAFELKHLAKLPLFLRSLQSTFPASYLKDQKLMTLLKELLLISTQSTPERVPAVVGMIALAYPADTHAPIGGMDQMAELMAQYLSERGALLHLRESALKIEKGAGKFSLEVTTTKDSYRAKRVFANLPTDLLEKILAPELRTGIQSQKRPNRHQWGAVVANFGVKLERPIEHSYHQIHLRQRVPWLHSSALFYSFSRPEDKTRAAPAQQAVTVSGHVELKNAPHKSAPEYQQFKAEFQHLVTQNFLEHFKAYGAAELLEFSVATPHTFERYTQRPRGRVGGQVHDISLPLFRFARGKTKIDGLYQVGDDTYPGGGVVGVVSGAQNLYDSLGPLK